jgi:molecular chaperone GrpE
MNVTEENKEARARAADASTGESIGDSASSAAAETPGEMPPNIETLDREISELRSKANTYLDLAQRTQADFVNYKRRVEQERSDYARGARSDIILRILGPLDDLNRAVESRPADLAASDWAQGIVLIDRKFRSALESLGAKPIEAEGKPFDPYQEEAVAHEPSETVPAESVTKVIRPGYAIDGRVIRPAQVVVSSGPPSDGSQ